MSQQTLKNRDFVEYEHDALDLRTSKERRVLEKEKFIVQQLLIKKKKEEERQKQA
jgi:hypothetical protein